MPTKLVTGVNVTRPVPLSSVHSPLLASVNDVCVHVVVSPLPQSLRLLADKPVPLSLVNGVMTMSPSFDPLVLSADAASEGVLIVAVIVELNA